GCRPRSDPVSRRALLFLLIVVCAVGGAGAYLLRAVQRAAPGAGPPQGSDTAAVQPLGPGEAPPAGPKVVFRRASVDQYNGALGVTPLADPASPRFVDRLRCERVHMAGGKGVGLVADRGVLTTQCPLLFDNAFRPGGELPLAGIPSRVQVAPDGRRAATTVFVNGHSYSDSSFSTRTSIVDLDAGKWLVDDLETFTVRRKGQPIQSPDFNFW